MEQKVHRYVQRKEILKRVVKNPFTASIILSSAYFIFSFVGLFITEYYFSADGGTTQSIDSHHFLAGLLFLMFSTLFIFGLTLYALSNLSGAYLRVELEKEKKNVALNLVDREIGELTRKISHDLKAPIRTMQGFSQAVTDDYADKLDPAALDYLTRIRKAAERMDNLINELVVYSRLSAKSPEFEAVDCVRFINKQVIPHIQSELPRNIIVKSSGAIPVVYADQQLLLHVLTEVIVNAATYIRAEVSPEIIVSGQQNEESTTIRIKDNGIGVDTTQKEIVFNIFTRLHGVEQYPGLGIGLAIAKRSITLCMETFRWNLMAQMVPPSFLHLQSQPKYPGRS